VVIPGRPPRTVPSAAQALLISDFALLGDSGVVDVAPALSEGPLIRVNGGQDSSSS
jgi:hypothetical protein